MSRRRYPLLRAVAELVNAANGVQPIAREGYVTIPVFAFGWPTSEMSPVYMAVSMLDALRRGLRGDFRGTRGRIALGAHRDCVGSAVADPPPQRLVAAAFRGAAARGAGRRLRADRQPVAAGAASPRPDRRVAQRPDPPPLRREDQHRAVRAASPGEPCRHLAPRRPARGTGRRRCCCRCPAARGRSACGDRSPTPC